MLTLLLSATFGWAPATPCADLPVPRHHHDGASGVFSCPQDPGGKPFRALEAWLKLYRKDKIDYRSRLDIGKDSIAAKYDVGAKNGLGHATWAGDLKLILSSLVAIDDAKAAQAIAQVAAVGLDGESYSYGQAPYDVRTAGLEALAGLHSEAAIQALVAGARGDWQVDRKQQTALRAAAMLGLGRQGKAEHRSVIEGSLADGDEIVRLHAIDALAVLGDEAAAPALIGVLERDTSDSALVAATKALRSLYAKYLRKPEPPPDTGLAPLVAGEGEPAKTDEPKKQPEPPTPPASTRLAVRAAIKALGRATWRADMEIVRLLDEFRSTETVLALIEVLERFRDNPDAVKDGRLSGLLLAQVHELLVDMTGAIFPATQPEKWREMWDKEKDNLNVTAKRPAVGAGHTVAAGFAGIPVEGTRVVFVLDLSGSMNWDMAEAGTDGKRKVLKRIDYAKRELLQAVAALAPNAQFNLVTFDGSDKAEQWSKKLVPATERNKERFAKHVNRLEANGGTNLWSGVESALDIKSLVYGNHYETTVDELFVLSDGAPTVGDVTDSIEILRLVEEVNRYAKVRINAVFISSETPPEYLQAEAQMSLTPKELMRRMAEQNGGRFRDV